MRVRKRPFWFGVLLICLAVAVWFAAPTWQSCVTDIDTTACDTTGVVVLNVIGLLLFVVGAGVLLAAGAGARGRGAAR